MAGTRCGLIGLDTVLSEGDGLGLSDFRLFNMPGLGAKMLSIVNSDVEFVLPIERLCGLAACGDIESLLVACIL
jgi:hypothetical protein